MLSIFDAPHFKNTSLEACRRVDSWMAGSISEDLRHRGVAHRDAPFAQPGGGGSDHGTKRGAQASGP